MSTSLYFARISGPRGEAAFVPTRATEGSAGVDFRSVEEFAIPPNGYHLFKTGLRVRLPRGKFMHICPRSGLALKHITVGGGVIDSDYDGEIGVILYNLSATNEYLVSVGDRIAQGIILDCHPEFTPIEVAVLPPLEDEMTLRGAGGFGSTGV